MHRTQWGALSSKYMETQQLRYCFVLSGERLSYAMHYLYKCQ